MAQHCLDTSTLCQLTQQDRLLVLILRDSAVPDPTQFFPRQFLYLQNWRVLIKRHLASVSLLVFPVLSVQTYISPCVSCLGNGDVLSQIWPKAWPEPSLPFCVWQLQLNRSFMSGKWKEPGKKFSLYDLCSTDSQDIPDEKTLLPQFYSTTKLAGYYLCRNSGLRTWMLCLASNFIVFVVTG